MSGLTEDERRALGDALALTGERVWKALNSTPAQGEVSPG